MKNLVLTIVSVLALSTINAQQDLIASVDVFERGTVKEIESVYAKSLSHPSDYFEKMEATRFSKVINNLQNDILNYDLKMSSIYDNTEKAIYNITFERNFSKASVTYNNEGQILSTVEKYKNVRLPVSLRMQIIRDNPLFIIDSNKVIIAYHEFLGVTITYKVIICKEKLCKTLKFDKDYNSI